MDDAGTFKSVSITALRHAHMALAEKAIEDEEYLPLFQEVDEQLAEAESMNGNSAVERARMLLRRQSATR